MTRMCCMSLPERKTVPLASVSEAPTYPPDFGIDDVEKSTADPLIGTGSSDLDLPMVSRKSYL